MFEIDQRAINNDIVKRNLKIFHDAMRIIYGLSNYSSMKYEELCKFPKFEMPLDYKIQ